MADLANAHPDNIDLHGDADARNWAERFSSMYVIRKRDQADPDYEMTQAEADSMLLTWFSSAIETGRSASARSSEE